MAYPSPQNPKTPLVSNNKLNDDFIISESIAASFEDFFRHGICQLQARFVWHPSMSDRVSSLLQGHAISTIKRVALATLAAPLSSCIYSSGGKVRVELPAGKEGRLGTTEVQVGAGRHL